MNLGVLEENRVVCRFNLRGVCRFGNRCRNIHEGADKMSDRLAGKIEVKAPVPVNASSSSGARALSPSRSKVSESNKENSEAAAGSSRVHGEADANEEGKTCGICYDAVLEKTELAGRAYGILPNCSHCFCFGCIRRWRQSREFDLEVAKACPECRVTSDFVYRSSSWLSGKAEKDAFIGAHKERMKRIDCRYFRRGDGQCPFGNTCLYAHILPDGKTMDVGPPMARRKRRRSGIEANLIHEILFWLNDSDLEDNDDDDLELDLSDPCIAMQYYEPGDIRQYMAWESLMRAGDDDDEDNDLDILFL